MKKTSPSTVFGMLAAIVALAITALAAAACAPIPIPPTASGTPLANVYAPAVENGPGVDVSPLQPASTSTTILHTSATAATATLVPVQAMTQLPPTATQLPALAGPVWQWVSSTFKDGTVLAPGEPGRYTFQLLGDGNALVHADCNFGAGSYQDSANSFSFGAIGTTKVACPPDSLDGAFLAQLRNIASYAIAEDELVITLKDRAGIMRLGAGHADAAPAPAVTEPATASAPAATGVTQASAPPPAATNPPPTEALRGTPVPLPTTATAATVLPALAGTNWLLVRLTTSGQAIPPVGQTPITVEIAADGSRIIGSTGCNEYRATFGRDHAGATVLGPALMTRRACPANVSVQEVAFMDALLRARSYVVRGNELTFIDVAGNPLLVFVRE